MGGRSKSQIFERVDFVAFWTLLSVAVIAHPGGPGRVVLIVICGMFAAGLLRMVAIEVRNRLQARG